MNTHPSQHDQALYQSYGQHLSQTYPAFLQRLGIDSVAVRAEGALITDSTGKSYIDCTAGYGLFNLGHNHPKLINALVDQLTSAQPLTRPLISHVQAKLGERLAAATPGKLDCIFLCNSGSEAIDSAMKLARLHTRKSRIIAAEGSFHGYTYGALSATGIPKLRNSFGPLLPDVVHVPYGDSNALTKAMTADTAAVLLEPVQHEAGVCIPPNGYLKTVRELCTKNETLFILDEVKTGFGKTGSLFACEDCDVEPDILVLGKSLGGGLIPSGAIVSTQAIWKKFSLSFSMSASSFAGNTLASRAAITALEIYQQDGFMQDCRIKGESLMRHLSTLVACYPRLLSKVTGKGLLIGLRTSNPRTAFNLSRLLAERGVLAMPAFGQGAELMIEPPLIITEGQISEVIGAIDNACQALDI